jgi:hypothetical protein
MENNEKFAYYDLDTETLFVDDFGVFTWKDTIVNQKKERDKQKEVITDVEKSVLKEINKINKKKNINAKKYSWQDIKEKRLINLLNSFITITKRQGIVEISSEHKKLLELLVLKYKILGAYPVSSKEIITEDGTKIYKYEFYSKE